METQARYPFFRFCFFTSGKSHWSCSEGKKLKRLLQITLKPKGFVLMVNVGPWKNSAKISTNSWTTTLFKSHKFLFASTAQMLCPHFKKSFTGNWNRKMEPGNDNIVPLNLLFAFLAEVALWKWRDSDLTLKTWNRTRGLRTQNRTRGLRTRNRTRGLRTRNRTRGLRTRNRTRGLRTRNQTRGLRTRNRTRGLRTRGLRTRNRTRGLRTRNRTRGLRTRNRTRGLRTRNRTRGLRTRDSDLTLKSDSRFEDSESDSESESDSRFEDSESDSRFEDSESDSRFEDSESDSRFEDSEYKSWLFPNGLHWGKFSFTGVFWNSWFGIRRMPSKRAQRLSAVLDSSRGFKVI